MKNKIHILFTTLVLVGSILLTACGAATPLAPTEAAPGADTLSGTLTVSGAFALYPMMTAWAEEFQKLHPKVQFDIQAGGAGKGMTDALAGAVDIGMVSRAIKPEEEAKGAYWVAVTKDAVFPVINAKNPVLGDILAKGINQETFKKIFITGETKTWGEVVGRPEVTDEIHVYTRSDAAGAADVWAQFSGGKAQGDLQGIGVNADPGLLDAVVKDPLGIGYNNLGFAFDLSTGKPAAGAVVAPIDVNGNGAADPGELIDSLSKATAAVASGSYPFPPARVENLVTRGKPSGLVQAFILWILTDGQGMVGQAGYVPLSAKEQADSLAKIK